MKFTLLFLFFSFGLYGNFEDHFKKCPHKEGNHRLKEIEFIYMINLDQRPEKFQKSIDQLAPYQIYPYRFSAVNGWELTWETINDVGYVFQPGNVEGILGTTYYPNMDLKPTHEIIHTYGQTYYSHCMARGPIGICLSHLSILQDAYDSNYQLIWVMEDDVEVLQDPRLLPYLVRELDHKVGHRNWDVLFTDRDMRDKEGRGKYLVCTDADPRRPDFDTFGHNDYGMKIPVGKKFMRIGARYGAHSMILTRSGIEKILNFFKQHKIYLPYDLEFIFPPGIRMYCTVEDVVSNLVQALSDNGSPNYQNKNQ